jgi:hypothetical protein
MLWNLIFFRENRLTNDDEIKKKLIWSNFQNEILDFCFAFLKYISIFWCRVSFWFDESTIFIEKFFDLIQILIVEKKNNNKFSLDEKLHAIFSTFVLYF